jgi:hypothetical protein
VYFRTVLRQHDQQLADVESARASGERAFRQMQDDHARRVEQMTEALAERVEAVLVRDRIIEELRGRPLFTQLRERLRRWLTS